MTALTITKRRLSRDNKLVFCHNGCRTGAGTRKVATHYAWILGRETPLCKRCSEEWPVMWAEALGPVSKGRVEGEAERLRVA